MTEREHAPQHTEPAYHAAMRSADFAELKPRTQSYYRDCMRQADRCLVRLGIEDVKALQHKEISRQEYKQLYPVMMRLASLIKKMKEAVETDIVPADVGKLEVEMPEGVVINQVEVMAGRDFDVMKNPYQPDADNDVVQFRAIEDGLAPTTPGAITMDDQRLFRGRTGEIVLFSENAGVLNFDAERTVRYHKLIRHLDLEEGVFFLAEADGGVKLLTPDGKDYLGDHKYIYDAIEVNGKLEMVYYDSTTTEFVWQHASGHKERMGATYPEAHLVECVGEVLLAYQSSQKNEWIVMDKKKEPIITVESFGGIVQMEPFGDEYLVVQRFDVGEENETVEVSLADGSESESARVLGKEARFVDMVVSGDEALILVKEINEEKMTVYNQDGEKVKEGESLSLYNVRGRLLIQKNFKEELHFSQMYNKEGVVEATNRDAVLARYTQDGLDLVVVYNRDDRIREHERYYIYDTVQEQIVGDRLPYILHDHFAFKDGVGYFAAEKTEGGGFHLMDTQGNDHGRVRGDVKDVVVFGDTVVVMALDLHYQEGDKMQILKQTFYLGD